MNALIWVLLAGEVFGLIINILVLYYWNLTEQRMRRKEEYEMEQLRFQHICLPDAYRELDRRRQEQSGVQKTCHEDMKNAPAEAGQ